MRERLLAELEFFGGAAEIDSLDDLVSPSLFVRISVAVISSCCRSRLSPVR